MGYMIDPRPRDYEGRALPVRYDATIVLVGCGGTGGFLADALGRLLLGRPARLFLVDPDRVEPHNTGRQAFDRREVGRFKAEVLAERLAQRYGREVGYAVEPYDRAPHAGLLGDGLSALALLVGAVDNAAARRALAATLDAPGDHDSHGWPGGRCWWLDLGNARNSGQLLLGNVARPERLRGCFQPDAGRCTALPAPHLQRPDLLVSPPQLRPAPDCAEAVAAGDQGATINQATAALAAGVIEQLLAGNLGWMALYADLDGGTLRPVPADPATVAPLAGLRPGQLVAPPRSVGTGAA